MQDGELIKHILTALTERDKKSGVVEPADIEMVIDSLKNNYNDAIIEDVRKIYQKIQDSKIALSLSSVKATSNYLPDAEAALEAVVKETENATNKIMDAAEELQAFSSNSESATPEELSEIAVRIFEASNFQDITGQRIRKVVKIIGEIEVMTKSLISSIGGDVEFEEASLNDLDVRPDSHLMNGPQLEEGAPTQDDIDKMFES